MTIEKRSAIFAEVEAERARQDVRWGTDVDDARNTPNDWVAYIAHHSTRWFKGGFTPYQPQVVDTFRAQMVKVAALAVAAIESLDRQRTGYGSASFESAE